MRSTSLHTTAVVILLGMTFFLLGCRQTPTAPAVNGATVEAKAAMDRSAPLWSKPADRPERTRGRGTGPIVYVRSQELYFDSIVLKDPLPAHGPFQLLEEGPNGLETEFGPGDRGYVGGRWMEDMDGDGTFHYFLCPLLGPGRESP